MAADLTFHAKDLPRFEAIVGQLLARASDTSPLMDRIGLYGESSTIDRFDTQTAPDGSTWPQSLRAKEDGGKTLTDTARLRQSIRHISSADSAQWGTNVIYAGTHQGGATITPKSAERLAFNLPGGLGFVSVLSVTIPKREFLGLSAEDEREIEALGEDYLGELLQ